MKLHEPHLVWSGLPRCLALLLSSKDQVSVMRQDQFSKRLVFSPPIGSWLSFAKQRLPFSGRGGCWVLNYICAFQQSGSLEFEANDGAAE